MAGGWRRFAGALVIMVLLSGCATTVSGTARSQPGAARQSQPSTPANAAPAEGTAAELLGDFTTLDPCSLTDTAEFAKFGASTFGMLDSLDDCLVEIRAAGAEPVVLYVGGLDRVESISDIDGKNSTDLAGGLRVVDYVSNSEYCNQLLVFTDGITLSVNASVYEGENSKLCEIVSTGVAEVVKVLRDGDVEHRDFRSNSLGRIDPCEVVPDQAVAAVAGLASVRPKSYPAQHGCLWMAGDGSSRLRVMFTVGPRPKPSGQGSTETTIVERPTVLSPTPDAGSYVFCGAHTGHIPFSAVGQSDLVEIASVFIRMEKGKLDAACRSATDVAGAVWPELPRP